LLTGAALFGIGWGLAGYCPGPGLAALTLGSLEPIVFVVCLLIGSSIPAFFTNRNEVISEDD
ncbi:MAG: putative membrane protein YedE/YeeE, partial [Gammaproteobacteria bacterium]